MQCTALAAVFTLLAVTTALAYGSRYRSSDGRMVHVPYKEGSPYGRDGGMRRWLAFHVAPPPRDLLASRRRRAVRTLMRSAFIGVALLASVPAQATTRTAQYGAVFCEDSLLLREFIIQLLEHVKPFDERPDRCEMLKSGLEVDVLRVIGALDGEHRIIAVRVHGTGGMVDGYTLSTNVEDATPAGP